MSDDNYALIPHVKEPKVLLLKSRVGWTLPQHNTNDASKINAAMKALLGCTTTVLYCAYDRYKDDEREEQHRVYVLENHSPNFLQPANAHWISKTDLNTIELAVADHYAVLEQWLNQAEASTFPDQRVPWASPGWFSSATRWVEMQMTTLGLALAGPIEQIQVSLWSTVLRLRVFLGTEE